MDAARGRVVSHVLDRFQAYQTALESVTDVTEEDLPLLIAELPAEIRDKLAAGPLPYRYDCGVCAAFGKAFYSDAENHRPEDPAFRAWAYHEVAKLRMRFKDQEHYGPVANEHYERTIATYRAAGWRGEAQEPNA